MACEKCNVVVNELLAFINNKVDVLDEVSIIQICDSAYTEQDVDAAKALLCACIPSCKRPTRKGDQRKKRTIQDIITVLKETEPDDVPKFVACDLNRLPPVSFDHVDVTAFLKDLAVIKKDIAVLKGNSGTTTASDSSIVAEVQMLKLAVEQLSQATTCQRPSPPLVRGTVSTQTENEVSGMQSRQNVASPNDGGHVDLQSSNNRVVDSAVRSKSTNNSRRKPPSPPASADSATASAQVNKGRRRRYRRGKHDEEVRTNPKKYQESKKEDRRHDDEGFILVENRKKRARRNKYGSVSPEDCSLKAAPRTSLVYVSRLRRGTEPRDVAQYIEGKGEKAISVDALPSHWADTDFCAFRLSVPAEKLNIFLRSEFWPKGVVFRRFIRAPQREMTRPKVNISTAPVVDAEGTDSTIAPPANDSATVPASAPVPPPPPTPLHPSQARVARQAGPSTSRPNYYSPESRPYRSGYYWDDYKMKWRKL